MSHDEEHNPANLENPVILSKTDRPTSVRQGEELPLERLSDYLKEQITSIEQFPSGFSNLTYLIHAGDRELVLRRPPIGAKIKTAHDMSREYRILSHLHPVYPKVPRPLLFCDDESILGAPFYVMERVTGIILRAQKPSDLDLSPLKVGPSVTTTPARMMFHPSNVSLNGYTRIFLLTRNARR